MDDLQANQNRPVGGSPDLVDSPIADLLSRFPSESEKKQLLLIEALSARGEDGLTGLMQLLRERQEQPVGVVEGKLYQALVIADTPPAREFLTTHFPEGLVPLRSQRNIDYSLLQTLLAKKNYLEADRLTLEKLCQLAGDSAVQRRWLYFTEVEQFPSTDLHTLNQLWLIFSEGKFGFSVQRDLWLGTGKNWEKLWPLIGWKSGNNWTRYPNGFIWDLSAPRGHLPLNNQLRGVRVFASLLMHPAWSH